MADLSGKIIGKYQIIEKLGEGGMAVVYRALDTKLQRDVALKILRIEELAPGRLERIQERFKQEAEKTAALTHPNIVTVLDFGEYEGAPYLVMQYVPGGTLKQKLDSLGKPMSYPEAARLLAPIARALDIAHRMKLVHRDVKPANILITPEGEPMLTDFGVARVLESEKRITLDGYTIGTPEYMAPEQWESKELDGRADEYALGVVFYEMITGRLPFTADTVPAIMMKATKEELKIPEELAEEAKTVLRKSMGKKPDERYSDLLTLAGELDRLGQQEADALKTDWGKTITTGETFEEITEKKSKKGSFKWWIVVVPVLLVASGIGYIFLGKTPALAPILEPTTTLTATPTRVIPTKTPLPTNTPLPTFTPTPILPLVEEGKKDQTPYKNILDLVLINSFYENEKTTLSDPWCAKDKATLEQNLKQLKWGFMINNESIQEKYFSDFGTTPKFDGKTWACTYKYISLHNWKPGVYTISNGINTSGKINDGYSDYEYDSRKNQKFVYVFPKGVSSPPIEKWINVYSEDFSDPATSDIFVGDFKDESIIGNSTFADGLFTAKLDKVLQGGFRYFPLDLAEVKTDFSITLDFQLADEKSKDSSAGVYFSNSDKLTFFNVFNDATFSYTVMQNNDIKQITNRIPAKTFKDTANNKLEIQRINKKTKIVLNGEVVQEIMGENISGYFGPTFSMSPGGAPVYKFDNLELKLPDPSAMVSDKKEENVSKDSNTGFNLNTLKPVTAISSYSFGEKPIPISSIDYSPDGSLIAATNGTNTIQVLSVNNEEIKLVSSIEIKTGAIKKVFFSKNGKNIGAIINTNLVNVWNVDDGKLISSTDVTGKLVGASFIEGDTKIWAGTSDYSQFIISIKDGVTEKNTLGNLAGITPKEMTLSPDENFISMVAKENYASVSPFSFFIFRRDEKMFSGSYVIAQSNQSTAFSQDGSYAAFSGIKSLYIWGMNSASVERTIPVDEKAPVDTIGKILFSHDPNLLIVSSGKRIRFINLTDKQILNDMEVSAVANITTMVISPKEPCLATGDYKGGIQLWCQP